MRNLLIVMLCLSVCTSGGAAAGSNSVLLKTGESPPAGWSIVIFQTYLDARVKVGDAEACDADFYSPCYFALGDGANPILVDRSMEYGDTTATIVTSGERVYLFKTSANAGRSLVRGAFGVIGAVATQPAEAPTSPEEAKGPQTSVLSNVRSGSRYDLELVSVSEPSKAAGFIRPPNAERPTYPR
jgi:hypothetical protein